MTADPLGDWWRHPIKVERLTGTGAYGDTFAPADDPLPLGFIDDRRRMVRDSSGSEVVSETTVALPITTPDVPPGSLVTLPATHGGRQATVLAVSRHDGGGQPTPDHLELALT